MQPPGNRISVTLPGTDGCGSPRTIRQFDPPPQETRSHSPSLDGFFRRENGGHNLKAHAGAKPRQTRSFSINTPPSLIDASAPNVRSNSDCGVAARWFDACRTQNLVKGGAKLGIAIMHQITATPKHPAWRIPAQAAIGNSKSPRPGFCASPTLPRWPSWRSKPG